ncbi:unnamed protein product [Urochloa decumbens]|uniref:AP2/ERF domain-containing protein n=1 Tax=Urochloa decumbens TaxID=240449 RepID=A0ABC9DR25_9POAL
MQPNAAAQMPPERHNSPSPSSGERKYKGVRWRKWGKWVSEIRLPNSRERIWLGSYDTAEKAARAFDAAYLCLRGPGGGADGLNFPGSPPPDVGRTSDPVEVYAAAMSHANRAAATVDDAITDQPPPVEAAPALVPAPVQVSAESIDYWSQLLAGLPPLFSPTHVSFTAEDDDVSMDDNERGLCPGLWSFDSTSENYPLTDHVDNESRHTNALDFANIQ